MKERPVIALLQPKLDPDQIQILQEALSTDHKVCNIRLREGEHQFNLAKAIASFHMEFYFPNVKDVIRKLYGDRMANDVQFVRKIQTILKKMEKSGVIRILPKKRPWELQRYALTSFRFLDVDKNLVFFATDQQIEQIRNLLNSMIKQQKSKVGLINPKIKIFTLSVMIIISYALVLWSLIQPVISPIVAIPALFAAIILSLILGDLLS